MVVHERRLSFGIKTSQGSYEDVLAVWRDWAADVRGRAVDCGHYLAEEAPDAVIEAFESFFV